MSMDIGALAPNTARTAYGGVLAVLLDDLLGFTVWDRRGTRDGLVSAELSVDVVTPRRWQGPTLQAEGRLLALTADGGTSTARVHDSAGTLIATGTLWGNFVDLPAPGADGSALPDFPEPGSRRSTGSAGGSRTDPTCGSWCRPTRWSRTNSGSCMAASGVRDGPRGERGPEPGRRGYGHGVRADQLFPSDSLDRDTTFTANVVRAGRSVAVARVAGTSGGRICVEATMTGRRRLS